MKCTLLLHSFLVVISVSISNVVFKFYEELI